MGYDYLYDYCKIDSYCKSEGLNTEYFIVSKNRANKHTRGKRDSDRLNKGR